MRKIRTAALAIAALLAPGAAAMAGTWTKAGTATGSLPETAQITTVDVSETDRSLTAITGTLNATPTGVERSFRYLTDVDMFRIYLTGGGTFSATTVGQVGGAYDVFDTRLYLFDTNGFGVYANDDDPALLVGARSTLPAGHALTPLTPGIYYLAVVAYGWTPASAEGAIFPDFSTDPMYDFTQVAGPTGPGGRSPLSGWVGTTAETGSYTVALTGAQFAAVVPEPGTLPVAIAGAFVLLIYHHRRRWIAKA